ncbi:hypothetical protein G7059_06345 [Erysipelothrix sp. HDW6A]|uniref:cell division protein FtsQ/DivIB n=1 Tax=Erysipelothrix sp. HDW6A TaxID=2714928 RepID=UPI00140978BC|nr:hypothetical protein [Erysipelothrix sp. HDW6A]QIK57488.1 hypothetical protein G7059_06345 [Erysipelothrix sp. HDW6A]
MYDENYGTDSMTHVKTSIKKRKKNERRRKRRIVYRRLFKILIIVAIITGMYYFDKSDMTRIRQVRITGNSTVPESEIVEKLNLHVGKRLITHLPFTLNSKASSLIGVDTIDTSIYYRQGIVNVVIHEKKVVGYTRGEVTQLLYEDGSKREVTPDTLHSINGVPLFIGLKEELLNKDNLNIFAKLDSEVLYSISEVHSTPSKYDETLLKLVMNNNYYVFSRIKDLPLLKDYASIIERAPKENRCIYFLEYGPNEDSQTVNTGPCE